MDMLALFLRPNTLMLFYNKIYTIALLFFSSSPHRLWYFILFYLIFVLSVSELLLALCFFFRWFFSLSSLCRTCACVFRAGTLLDSGCGYVSWLLCRVEGRQSEHPTTTTKEIFFLSLLILYIFFSKTFICNLSADWIGNRLYGTLLIIIIIFNYTRSSFVCDESLKSEDITAEHPSIGCGISTEENKNKAPVLLAQKNIYTTIVEIIIITRRRGEKKGKIITSFFGATRRVTFFGV